MNGFKLWLSDHHSKQPFCFQVIDSLKPLNLNSSQLIIIWNWFSAVLGWIWTRSASSVSTSQELGAVYHLLRRIRRSVPEKVGSRRRRCYRSYCQPAVDWNGWRWGVASWGLSDGGYQSTRHDWSSCYASRQVRQNPLRRLPQTARSCRRPPCSHQGDHRSIVFWSCPKTVKGLKAKRGGEEGGGLIKLSLILSFLESVLNF